MHATERSTRPGGTGADLVALRRRLYAPDSTEADVERYRAAVAAAEPAPTALPSTPRRSRRRPLVAGVGVALLLVGAATTGVLVSARRSTATSGPAPSPVAASPAPESARQDWLVVPASDRAGFVEALSERRPAGILEYLYHHPERIPGALRTTNRAASDERWGTGPSTLRLTPSALAEHGGSATVLVVLDRPARFTWQATRVIAADEGMEVSEVLASDSAQAAAGDTAVATFDYRGSAPGRLELDVGQDVRWGVVVVFTD